MDSIVLELQAEASRDGAGCANLLRMALMVAVKLKLPDLQVWVKRELSGYAVDDLVPKYRILRGEMKALDPTTGRSGPVMFAQPDLAEAASVAEVRMPIGSLEAAMSEAGPDGTMQLRFGEEKAHALRKLMHDDEVVPYLSFTRSQLAAMFEAVRNEILTWALQLESDGILGHGMTFTKGEQERAAATMQTFNIQTLNGVAGTASHSTVTVTDFSTVHGQLKALGIGQAERNELESIMDEFPVASPEKKEGLLARAGTWIAKNKASLGMLAGALRKFFGLA